MYGCLLILIIFVFWRWTIQKPRLNLFREQPQHYTPPPLPGQRQVSPLRYRANSESKSENTSDSDSDRNSDSDSDTDSSSSGHLEIDSDKRFITGQGRRQPSPIRCVSESDSDTA